MSRYTFKVYPEGLGRNVYRTMEISGEETLDDLCEFILECFDFIHEHMYEFCMDNRAYSEDSFRFDPNDDASETNIQIDELVLDKGQNFSLHYDFGDDWMFTIHVQKIEEEKDKKPPVLVKSMGKVAQYRWMC